MLNRDVFGGEPHFLARLVRGGINPMMVGSTAVGLLSAKEGRLSLVPDALATPEVVLYGGD